MAITANKLFWTEFIDIYHSLPSLWNTKDENYNNRESRSLGWDKLVKKMQEIEPDANQDSVKRKINTFRSNFNREIRKIRYIEKTRQAQEIYNPTLWYFENLSFLLSQEKNSNNSASLHSHYDEEMSSMGPTIAKSEIVTENESLQLESINGKIMRDDDKNSKSYLEFKTICRDKSADLEQDSTKSAHATEILQRESTASVQESVTKFKLFSPFNNHTRRFENIDNFVKSDKISNNKKSLLLNTKTSRARLKSRNLYNRRKFGYNFLSSSLTDEAAIYGQAWACGFRKLNPQQKLFAKKAIDEILILGRLKALKLNTVHMSDNLLEENCDQD